MRFILSVVLLMSSYLSFGQIRYTLKVNFPSEYNDHKVFLRVHDYYSNQQYQRLDSTTVKNGSFVFNGSINKPCELAFLFMTDHDKQTFSFSFVLDSGLSSLTLKKISEYDLENKSKNAEWTNSVSNSLDTKLAQITETCYNLYGVTPKDNPDIKTLSANRKTQMYQLQVKELVKHPNEFYDLIILRYLLDLGVDVRSPVYILEAFNKLSLAIQSTSLGREVDSAAIKESSVFASMKSGHKVPEFLIKTDKGHLINNKSFQGTPYVLAFSATWCAPCQYYQKKMLSLYHKYKTKGLRVIYFNLDDNVSKWKEHIRIHKLDWINVSEDTKFSDSKIAKEFDVYYLPSYFVIDKKGNMIYNDSWLHDENFNYLESYIKRAIN